MTDSGILSRPRFESLPTRRAEEKADHYCDNMGLHLYTFDQVHSTDQWRQGMLGPKETSGTGALG